MTDLLRRPDLSAQTSAPSTHSEAPRPPWLVGGIAGGVLAVAGAAVAMGLSVLGWLAASDGSLSGAMRIGADAWLLGHGSGLRVAGAQISAIPLGITGAVGVFAYRGGRWAAEGAQAQGVRTVGTITAAYTLA
ncbi:MAG: cell division protein PerM, partial [Nocardioidaceae bacterium]